MTGYRDTVNTPNSRGSTTIEESGSESQRPSKPTPGVLVFVRDQQPAFESYRLGSGALLLGRGGDSQVALTDPLLSRDHASIRFGSDEFVVRDLGSRNGTFVNGNRVAPDTTVAGGAVLRIGGSLILLCSDVRDLALDAMSVQNGVVLGPALRSAMRSVARAHSSGRTLLIRGETGTGKEIVARAFHDQGPDPSGPFLPVNCGAIPEGLAERLIFGSRRGAFSGATDAPGFAQRADGGTLFLDEVAELDEAVQVKLLRLIETGEVQRLGGEKSEQVNVRVCAATWRDLRAEVVAGRFREDLYFRMGRPEIGLPPLRERLYEIPWHVADELGKLDGDVRASAAFFEECVLRSWPGNVRELRAEVRRAAALAAEAGRLTLTPEDLDPQAGISLAGEPASGDADLPDDDDEIAIALRAEGGNVARAARRLGIHRNKVRRWLARHGVDPKRFR